MLLPVPVSLPCEGLGDLIGSRQKQGSDTDQLLLLHHDMIASREMAVALLTMACVTLMEPRAASGGGHDPLQSSVPISHGALPLAR